MQAAAAYKHLGQPSVNERNEFTLTGHVMASATCHHDDVVTCADERHGAHESFAWHGVSSVSQSQGSEP